MSLRSAQKPLFRTVVIIIGKYDQKITIMLQNIWGFGGGKWVIFRFLSGNLAYDFQTVRKLGIALSKN